MKPYYQHAGVTIYHGDCREALESGLKADLLCTDPPYGIGASRRAFGSRRVRPGKGFSRRGACYQAKDFGDDDWDDAPAAADLIASARSSCKDAVIWGGNYFNLPPSMRWLVWDKRNDGTSFADCELAWTNQRNAVRIFRYRWSGMLQEHGGRGKELRVHPTMKPLPLMKWCIGFFPEAQSVLDPFMGSGSTLVAAKALGLTAVGIEREEKYCETAAVRLAQGILEFD
jgi:DNA modification methylase